MIPIVAGLIGALVNQPPHAVDPLYLDPGTGSMLLQLILAGAMGALVILKLYWKRIKSLFGKKNPSDEYSVDDDDNNAPQ